nr:DUF4272 domain-containing protein [Rhizobium laguerreae]
MKSARQWPGAFLSRGFLSPPSKAVVQRTIALAIVAVKGETGDHEMGQALIRQFDATSFFTPKERAFMDDPDPTDQDRTNFAWRYEGVHVTLWALGISADLERPDHICDVPFIANTLRELGTDGLMRRAKLRPQKELLDAGRYFYGHMTLPGAWQDEGGWSNPAPTQ